MVVEKSVTRTDLLGQLWSDRFEPVQYHGPDKIKTTIMTRGLNPPERRAKKTECTGAIGGFFYRFGGNELGRAESAGSGPLLIH